MTMKLAPFIIAAGFAVVAATAIAQTTAPVEHSQMDHSKMGHGTPAKAGDAPSTSALKAANDKMHASMDIAYSGDADVDFVKGMIPITGARLKWPRSSCNTAKILS